MNFYDGFLSKYLPCYVCDRFNIMMELLDSDHSGGIGWDELSSRAKWALNQYPGERETWTLDDLLSIVFEKHLLPEAFRIARDIVKEKEQMKSVTLKKNVSSVVQKLKMKAAEHKSVEGVPAPAFASTTDGSSAAMDHPPQEVESIAEAIGVDTPTFKKPVTDVFTAAAEKGPAVDHVQEHEKEVEQERLKSEKQVKEKHRAKESHFFASIWKRTKSVSRLWRGKKHKKENKKDGNQEKSAESDGMQHSDTQFTSFELGSPGKSSQQISRDFSVGPLSLNEDRSKSEELAKEVLQAEEKDDESKHSGLESCDFHFNSAKLRKLRQQKAAAEGQSVTPAEHSGSATEHKTAEIVPTTESPVAEGEGGPAEVPITVDVQTPREETRTATAANL